MILRKLRQLQLCWVKDHHSLIGVLHKWGVLADKILPRDEMAILENDQRNTIIRVIEDSAEKLINRDSNWKYYNGMFDEDHP